MDHTQELIVLRQYLDVVNAELDQALLRSCGIETFVTSTSEASILPHLSHLLKVRLLVKQEQLKNAELVLKSSPEPSANATGLAPLESDSVSPTTKTIKYAYRALIFGSLILPVIANLYSLFLTIKLLQQWGALNKHQRILIVCILAANIAILSIIPILIQNLFS